ncbi:MAG: hypothetical protein ACRDVD_04080 [Acidimicrobiia bacterium]
MTSDDNDEFVNDVLDELTHPEGNPDDRDAGDDGENAADDDYEPESYRQVSSRQVVAAAIEEPRPRASVGELQDMVDDLIAHLHAAKTMPLSSSVLVDREQFLVMLERLRSELPDELRAARWMVREREAFIARTNEKAEDIVDKAKLESVRLVDESHIVAEAVEEANILVRRAEGESRRLRLEAEDDIERGLERVEDLLSELLGKVHFSREELHRARPKPPEVPL